MSSPVANKKLTFYRQLKKFRNWLSKGSQLVFEYHESNFLNTSMQNIYMEVLHNKERYSQNIYAFLSHLSRIGNVEKKLLTKFYHLYTFIYKNFKIFWENLSWHEQLEHIPRRRSVVILEEFIVIHRGSSFQIDGVALYRLRNQVMNTLKLQCWVGRSTRVKNCNIFYVKQTTALRLGSFVI